MLHRHKFIPHLLLNLLRFIQRRLRLAGDIEAICFPAAPADLRQLRYLTQGHLFQIIRRKPHLHHKLGDQASLLPQQAQQQMALLDLLITVFPGKVSCALQRFQRFLCVLLCIHVLHLLSRFSTLSIRVLIFFWHHHSAVNLFCQFAQSGFYKLFIMS